MGAEHTWDSRGKALRNETLMLCCLRCVLSTNALGASRSNDFGTTRRAPSLATAGVFDACDMALLCHL